MSDRLEETDEPAAAPGRPSGLVLMLHGGRSVSTEPAGPAQLAVLRVAALALPVRQALRGSGVIVRVPRFSVRGWNGGQASPVADLNRWLDEAAARYGPVPVALIGHSMGGRAALRAAGHPQVTAVAGLAPWLPAGEPVTQLSGTWVLLAHGDRDRVTSVGLTWEYASRAAAVTRVSRVPVPGGDHAMLRREPAWRRIVTEFARAAFCGLGRRPPGSGRAHPSEPEGARCRRMR